MSLLDTFKAYRAGSIGAAIASPNPPVVKVEQVDTEVIAWRGWGVALDDWNQPILHSVTYTNVRWDGPTLTADQVPTADNPHGIYGKAFREALEQSDYGQQLVIGEVALSGTVVEGVHGYRGERAVIRSLYLRDDASVGSFAPLLLEDALASRYQVTVQRRKVVKVVISNQPAYGSIYTVSPYSSQQTLQSIFAQQGQGGYGQQLQASYGFIKP